MSKRKTYLLLTALFTLLFIALVTLGSYLLSIQSKQFGIAAFLFAFGAVSGQVGSLALFLREHARHKIMQAAASQTKQDSDHV
ncbi:NGO_0222 family membrane protein [Neisseria canis]|uniref:Uncharacterized protein n=1 Tax=Neisseria canis TaxID=493 RepID=A0A1X3CZC4_9NEIS|nr:NGO_0222 family membrane protein [Neisseria canis]OSI13033.1 hypothetical protein BWD07_02925 [Neisseria canis]VEF02558.1 Uncharacterised protein [Neisseria canis]